MTERIKRLTTMAMQLRRDVVNTVFHAGDGHPGPCMSIADILTALYFDILRLDPENPDWMGRDRFIVVQLFVCKIIKPRLSYSLS